MEIQSIFAENMRKYRKEAKLTQEKLAEICNTDPQYIQQIETEVRCPSLEYVERIAKALNIAAYRLFFSENDMDSEFMNLNIEQKQKIKAMIQENSTELCAKIDEGIINRPMGGH